MASGRVVGRTMIRAIRVVAAVAVLATAGFGSVPAAAEPSPAPHSVRWTAQPDGPHPNPHVHNHRDLPLRKSD
ncbi:hypothetical protein, partial [Nocardia abscessus]|uniref:hypothetical protein n=1 Tax=Nocardia abscessus TaxID=120957 RepID=UPI0024542D8A